MLLSNYIIFLIFLIHIYFSSQIVVVPYLTKVIGTHSYIEYYGHTYTSTIELIKKLFKDRRIKNLKDVYLYNAGIKKGRLVIPTNLRTCESIMPYIDSRYVSMEIDVTSTSLFHQKVYYCKGEHFYSFEKVVEHSLRYRCHIQFEVTMQMVTRKPSIAKPTPAPKTFYVKTVFGKVHYTRNFATYHIWKELWMNCDVKCYCNFKNTKKRYVTEINRYRRYVQHPQLFYYPKLNDLAQRRADLMANHQKLISDTNQKYDEVIGSIKLTTIRYFVKMLFDDAWYHNPDFSRISATKRDFTRIMSSHQKYVGIGMAHRNGIVYVCIKFTPKSLYTE